MNLEMFVFRHGVSWGNIGDERGKIHQGQCPSDPGLAPHGLLQAKCMAHFLRKHPISGIFASPLPRALQCAYMIQSYQSLLVPIYVDLDIMEITNGAIDGMPFREMAERYPEVFVRWNKKEMDIPLFPGGESQRSVSERVANALTRAAIISARSKLYPHYGGNPVVVSHGGALGLGFARLENIPLERFNEVFPLENASLNILHWDDAREHLSVKKWNITSYLGKLKYSPKVEL